LLQLWDLATGKEIRTVARDQRATREVALAPDGKSVWTAAWGDELRQWDLATGKQLLHMTGPSDEIHGLALSPDGKRLAIGTHGHDVILWDTAMGRKVPDFGGHHFLITGAAFTPDGKHLWTSGFDRTIRLWSAASGEQLRCLSLERDKGDGVYSLALRPDDKMLAAAVFRRLALPANPHSIRLWDLTTGEERKPLLGHAGLVTAVAFSPDGLLLASREDQPSACGTLPQARNAICCAVRRQGRKASSFLPMAGT
jgi:WD40 repeat protein